jgi:beta-xylosidase
MKYAAFLLLLASSWPQMTLCQAANPILSAPGADPHAAIFGNRCYVYATDAGKTEPGFAVWSSPDLVTWTNHGMALRFADTSWAKNQDWAPGIIERDGKFYLYFSAQSSIGVAVSDSPIGPFKDPLGKPLIPFRDDLSTIDPMAFIDDDGQAYLYWGAVPGSWLKGKAEKIYGHLFVRRLNRDMVSFDGPELATVETDPEKGPHIEGSFVVKRKGVYYLMWSTGSWDAGGGPHAYRVEYATAPSPTGPFVRANHNPILESDHAQKIVGPGHHSVIQIPGTDDYYIVYHMHNGDKNRRVFIDRFSFADDGRIEAVKPTIAGVGPVRWSGGEPAHR